MKKLVLGGLVSVVAAVTVVAVVLWSPWSAGGDIQTTSEAPQVASEAGGTGAPVGIKGIIGYTVRDANGNVKDSGVIHNTVNAEALNEVFNRITESATGGAYDAIAALDTTEDPSDGVDSTSITTSLDGDTGTTGDQNPADGSVSTDFGSETGNGTVVVTFTAGDSVTVAQIVLTKAAEDDTSDGTVAIVDSDIFAYVDVPDVSLAASDTVQYTWTVDVD